LKLPSFSIRANTQIAQIENEGIKDMQTQKQNTFIDSDLPSDDIDILFSHLQTIQPPPALTARILSQLPARPTSVALFLQPMALHELDNWTTQYKKRKLC
jgi:hypothetical protein